MKEHFAIATAIYGGCTGRADDAMPRKMTWTAVRGSDKRSMVIDQSLGVNTRTLGAAHTRVADAMNEFLVFVRDVVALQQKNGLQQPVPVVYGSSIEIHSQDLVEELVAANRAKLGKVAVLADPAFMAHMLRTSPPGTTPQALFKETLKLVQQALMAGSVPAGALQYETRDYAAAGCGVDWHEERGAVVLEGNDAQQRADMVNGLIPADMRSRFDATYMEVIMRGNADKRQELHDIVRGIARIIARHAMVARDEHGNVINRFISAATPKTLNAQSDIRNFIFSDAELRTVYGEAYMAAHGIRHNVCFKTSLDTPNPPFVDIAGTLLADQFDARDGTHPTAVMVRR